MKDDVNKSGAPRPVTKVKLRLDVKDVVKKPAAAKAPEPEEGDPIVLFEDNHLLVVVKPQNVPSQADDSGDDDMLTILKRWLIKKYDKPGDAYLGLLHRLDRPTGGVMVFAKTSKAAARMSEKIRNREVKKTYAAVTVGRPNRTGLVEHYLAKDDKTNDVKLVPASIAGAMLARSDIRVVEESGGMSLVSVDLQTGRKHQARVQLKALGSPIVGDKRYAGDKYVQSPHLALWAYELAFTHPVTGEDMKFLSLPPEEKPWTDFNVNALIDFVRPSGGNHY